MVNNCDFLLSFLSAEIQSYGIERYGLQCALCFCCSYPLLVFPLSRVACIAHFFLLLMSYCVVLPNRLSEW
jgi:hypothetical protein